MIANVLTGEHRTSVLTGTAGLIIAVAAAFFLLHSARQPQAPKPPPVITMVMIRPQPPPPPPPPMPQPKTIVQPKMTTPEVKPMIPNTPPKAAPPKPAAPAQTAMGTSIHSNGPADAFNLNGTPGGNGMFDSSGGGGGGSRWGYYASIVQVQIQQALQRNPITRKASAGLAVRIWADANGVVTHVELDKSSGNQAVDAAVTNDVLLNLRLSQPPPSDMPMPIVMSLTGEQPL
jgi:outer membrane biosynthesis protein TonB